MREQPFFWCMGKTEIGQHRCTNLLGVSSSKTALRMMHDEADGGRRIPAFALMR
jgi:hypothetical protein